MNHEMYKRLSHEPGPTSGETEPGEEYLDPRHFYAAYVYEEGIKPQPDITAVVAQAQALGYPVRYWWLSEVMPVGEAYADPLIVCVHCPTGDEDAGLDLYQALRERNVNWDSLEAATAVGYRRFGKAITQATDIFRPDGTALFPEVSAFLSHSETHGLSTVLLVLSDLRMKEFSPEAREQMQLSLQRLSRLFLLLLGQAQKLEAAGQTPAHTFAFMASMVQDLTSFYQMLAGELQLPTDEEELPF